MKKYAKITAAVLSCALVATAFAGCGEKKPSTSDGKTIITKWDGDTHAQKGTEALVKEFNETIGKENNIEYQVEFKEGGTITQNMDVALSTGSAPDFLYGGSIQSLVEQGYLLAVDDLKSGKEIIAKYADTGLLRNEIKQYQGKTYAVPVSATTQGMDYNKDMFKEAGIVDENGEPTPPKTWEQFREYAKKLTNEAEGKYGVIAPIKWTGFFDSVVRSPAVRSQGYYECDPTDGTYNLDKIAKIAQYWVDMKNDGSVYPDAEGVDNDPARARFSDGIIGMKMAFSFDVGVFNDQFPATCDWGVAHYPVLDENEIYNAPMWVASNSFMNAAAKDKIDAMEIVFKYVTSDDYVRTCYKEGVNLPWSWIVVEDIELGADAKHGWKEFAALVDNSVVCLEAMKYVEDGIDSNYNVFVRDVWSGNKPAAEVYAEREKVINAAIAPYYEAYPDLVEAHADRIEPNFLANNRNK